MLPNEELQKQSQLYRMPPVARGDFVNWFMDGNPQGTPRLACIESVGDRAINVFVISSDRHGLMNSVHHHTDPELTLRAALKRKHGVWEYRPEEVANKKELDELRQRVSDLESRLASQGNGHVAKPKEKRELSPERKQALRDQLAKGRETVKKNRDAELAAAQSE